MKKLSLVVIVCMMAMTASMAAQLKSDYDTAEDKLVVRDSVIGIVLGEVWHAGKHIGKTIYKNAVNGDAGKPTNPSKPIAGGGSHGGGMHGRDL